MARPVVLAIGGTRSGKSRFGLRVAGELAGGGAVRFVATARPGVDPELDDRIARHRLERPAGWYTVEVAADLAAAISDGDPDEPILIDGLTLWLATLLDDAPEAGFVDIDPILDGPVSAVFDAIDARPGAVVVVSDDVGGGIVPMHAGARAFRDLAGIVHQRLATRADEVHLLVAGIPLALKGPDRR